MPDEASGVAAQLVVIGIYVVALCVLGYVAVRIITALT